MMQRANMENTSSAEKICPTKANVMMYYVRDIVGNWHKINVMRLRVANQIQFDS